MEVALDRSELRFVLLQARNPGDPAREAEVEAFRARLDVAWQQIRSVDLLCEPLDGALLEGAHALLVGGAGEYSVVDPVPPVRDFISFLARVADGSVGGGIPTFASCFGFQALVVGLGGEVVEDEPNAEVGTYPLELTPAGARDPLLATLPRRFMAQLGHKDRAVCLPDGIPNLASSERAPFQALRVPGTQIVATQFHPELTWRDNQARFRRYMATYGRLFGEEAAQRQLDSHVPSPEANALLGLFVDQVLLAVRGGP